MRPPAVPAWIAGAKTQQSTRSLPEDLFSVVRRDADVLKTKTIEIKRVKSINHAASSKERIRKIVFHPSQALAFVLEKTRKIRIFDIGSEKRRRPIHTVSFRDNAITAFCLINEGCRLLAGGRSAALQVLELCGGKATATRCIARKDIRPTEKLVADKKGVYVAAVFAEGTAALLHQNSLQTAKTISTGKKIVDVCFDEKHFCALSIDGRITRFSLKTLHKKDSFVGSSGSKATALDCAEDWIFCGAESGLVSFYEAESLQERKTLANLTTAADLLSVHPSGQLFAIGSTTKKNALRLVNAAELSVYKNWPAAERIGFVTSIDFSPCGKYFAVCNSTGEARLHLLSHFAAEEASPAC